MVVGLDLQGLSEALARLQPQGSGGGQVAVCQGMGFSRQRIAPVAGCLMFVGLDLQGLCVALTRLQPQSSGGGRSLAARVWASAASALPQL